MINVPLLNKVFDHIVAHPEEWNQTFWAARQPSCGTAYCFAGFACVISGYDFVWKQDWTISTDVSNDSGLTRRKANVVAAELLGLDDYQAEWLFAGGNELNDLRGIITHLTGLTDAEL